MILLFFIWKTFPRQDILKIECFVNRTCYGHEFTCITIKKNAPSFQTFKSPLERQKSLNVFKNQIKIT